MNDISVFTNFVEQPKAGALVAEGTSKVLGYGQIDLTIWTQDGTRHLTLKKVYYAPNMRRNLISVGLMDVVGFKRNFYRKGVNISLPGGENFLNVPLKNRMYSFEAEARNSGQRSYMESNTIERADSDRDKEDVMNWHSRFGHQNIGSLIDLQRRDGVYGLENMKGTEKCCTPCLMGKTTKASHKKINGPVSREVLDLVHLDVWGPSPTTSLGGARYFLSIIDDYSRYTVVYTMSRKSDVFYCFREYLADVERQKGKKLKAIRSDNGLEFCSKDFEKFLTTRGIRIQRRNTYSPEMNGVAERFNRSAIESVRTLLMECKLPKALWSELLHTYVHVKNRFPHMGVRGEIPYKAWTNKDFSEGYLRKMDSLVFVHEKGKVKSKLEPRAKMGILVGYAFRTRGYRIWFPNTRSVIENKHLKILEKENGMEWLYKKKDKNCDHEISAVSEQDFNCTIHNDFDVITNVFNDSLAEPEQEGSTEEPRDSKKSEPSIPDPSKWDRQVRIKEKGTMKGRADVTYTSESGKKLRCYKDIKEYCRQHGICYKKGDFCFTENNENGEIGEEPCTSQYEKDRTLEANYLEVAVPKSYKETLKSKYREQWCKAMGNELQAIKGRDVYELVDRPNGKVIGSKWVFNIKRNS